MYSTEKELNIPADSAQFEAVYWHNECIYREVVKPVIIRPKPNRPRVEYRRKSFCPGESVEILSSEISNEYIWSNGHKAQKQFIDKA